MNMRWVTNKEKTNLTYETTDTRTKKNCNSLLFKSFLFKSYNLLAIRTNYYHFYQGQKITSSTWWHVHSYDCNICLDLWQNHEACIVLRQITWYKNIANIVLPFTKHAYFIRIQVILLWPIMLKLLALLNINSDGRRVWLSLRFRSPIFRMMTAHITVNLVRAMRILNFKKTVVRSAKFRITSYWRK